MEQEERLCDGVKTVREYWGGSGAGRKVMWCSGNCEGILGRQWSRKKGYVMEWKLWGNIGEAVEQEEKLCDVVETVREFTYLGDRVSAGGGCEATVTARTWCE